MFVPVLITLFTLTMAKIEDFRTPSAPIDKNYYAIKASKEEQKILKNRGNFTTCDEFLNNTKLDISKIIDIEWQVFYYWVDVDKVYTTKNIITFRLTDVPLVERFKSGLSEKSVNWTEAELFMESNVEFSGILVATNQSGLYDIVPSLQFTKQFYGEDKYYMALRFMEPHYLGLMNCKFRQLLAMAPVDKMPKDEDEEVSLAKQFRFRSDLGISNLQLIRLLEKPVLPKSKIQLEDDRELDMSFSDPRKDFNLL